MMDAKYVLAHVNNKKIKIRLGLYRPLLDSYGFRKWNKLEVEFVNVLKGKLERGEISESDIEGEMTKWSVRQIEVMEKKKRKLKVYELMEDKLNKLNEEIRSSLKRDKKKCIRLLKDLQVLDLEPIILKKNPSIVNTILLVNEYQYSITGIITRRRMAKLKKKVEEKKQQVHNIIRKFNTMFNVPANKSFFEVFLKEKELFQQQTYNMSVDDMNDYLSSAV